MSAVQGVLEIAGNAGGHLRRREAGYLPSGGDIRVGERLIRQFGLRTGDDVAGETQNGRGGAALERVTAINGAAADAGRERPEFNRLTAIHPNEQLRLESVLARGGQPDLTNRVIDLLDRAHREVV